MKIVSIVTDSFVECAPFNWGLTLFSYGCNLKCEMCKGYNYETVTNKDRIIGNAITIIKDKLTPAHDCVVFLGGEPTIHGYKLIEALEFCKNYNLKTKVFTNGIKYDIIREINKLCLCDSWSVDLKCTKECTNILGIDITDEYYLECIDKSISNIINHRLPLEIRTTLTESNKDQIESIKKVCSKYNVNHILQKDHRKNIPQ